MKERVKSLWLFGAALASLFVGALLSTDGDAQTESVIELEAVVEAEAVLAAGGALEAPRVEIPRALQPLPGVLTGGQPSEAELEAVLAAGYRTIVNLRPPGEPGSWDEGALVEANGGTYLSIPVAGAAGMTWENVDALFTVLDDIERYPVFIHCASGNRIGGLFAMRAFQHGGLDIDAAIEVGLAAGLTRLEDTVREVLSAE